jgi:serine/threonine protein kinase
LILPENLIGKGGHAEVYKGQLADGQFVAVKRLTKGGNKEDRVSDFLSELGIIAHVNHPNAAQLLGFSVEGGLHLVLQFSPHGSLASVLHGIFFSKNTFFLSNTQESCHQDIKKKRARAQIASIFYKSTQDYDSSYISGHWH